MDFLPASQASTDRFCFLGLHPNYKLPHPNSALDATTGNIHNYNSKNHLLISIFGTPKDCGWSKERQTLANAIEVAEERKDSRVGREIVTVCPNGMNQNTFIGEVTAYTNWLQKRYRTTIVADIHDPYKDTSKPPETGRNLHVHITVPTREVTPQGMGVKLRELDERSYAKRGIDCIPEPKIGPAGVAINERGLYSHRWEHREDIRVENETLQDYLPAASEPQS